MTQRQHHSDRCRCAAESDIQAVSELHIHAFEGHFLSRLGQRFLNTMYRAFLNNSSGIFVVHESEQGTIDGFAVGVLASSSGDRRMAIKYLPQFMIATLPAAVRAPALIPRRLWRRFTDHANSLEIPSDAVILRSIGVSSSARGTGAASSLLTHFEHVSQQRGAQSVYLTTDEADNMRAQRFYTKHGYSLSTRFQQDETRAMWLMKKAIALA